MEFHEISGIFPLMDDEKFVEFCASLKKHGQLDEIDLYEGKILDGRNRFLACENLGIEPRYHQFTGADPVEYVWAKNFDRRQLDASQRSMAGARKRELLIKRGKERSLENLRNQPAKSDENIESANLPSRGGSAEAVARLVQTSPRTIKYAAKVLREGVPELTAAVDAAQVTAINAATLLALPPEEQKATVAKGEDFMREKAQELRAKAREPVMPYDPSTPEPLAAKGPVAVKKYMDKRVEEAALAKEPLSPEDYFEKVKKMRTDLVG